MKITRPTKLFMSVDLEGSTNFKQSSIWINSENGWLSAFETFFREFPVVLIGQTAVASQDSNTIPFVDLWKVIGDEMIFTATLQTTSEALKLTEAFYRAVVAYDQMFFEQWPLRLRGTCWAGDFTTRNIELVIPEMEGVSGPYVDYLGPEVDVGFRLSKHGTSGNVILSMELAELLAECLLERGQRFHYAGKAELKGVLSGKPYPLIFITFEDVETDFWRWEAEEIPQVKSLRDDPPISRAELVTLIRRIRNYVNKNSMLNLRPLNQ